MNAAGRPYLNAALTMVAPAIWGSTYLVTTEFLPPGRPLLAALMRALGPGLIMLGFGRVLPRGDWWWRALVLGALNVGVFFYLLFVAAYHLPGGVAALVGSIQPTIVLVLSALLLGDRIRPVHVAACVLAFAGVALLVLKSTARLDAVGVLAAIAGAFSMGTGIVLTKRWKRPDGVSLLTLTGWQLTAGGLMLLGPAFAIEGVPARLSGENVLGYAYLGLIGALFAFMLWFRGLERLPATAVSFLSLTSPLVATILGWVALGESLAVPQIIGALIVVGAVALIQASPPRPAQAPPGEAADPRAAEPAVLAERP